MASLICKTVKGKPYWYIVESRRIDGKVKQVILEYIGSQKNLSKRLLQPPVAAPCFNDSFAIKSYSHGCPSALMEAAYTLGIPDILDSSFAPPQQGRVKRSTSLLLAAIHRAADPGSKMGFSSWFDGTSLPWALGIHAKDMTSQHFWDQMDGITEGQLRSAEDLITGRILERYPASLERLALDYTNYFTYIATDNKRCTIAKRGHNKQKRHGLRQCSLAVVTTKEFGIPLFSHVYEGNRNDRTEFGTYIKLLRGRLPEYSPETTTIVFDGGSNSKENLESLEMHYICSFSMSGNQDLYEVDITEYKEETLKSGEKVNAYRLSKKIWGKERDCILTFSQSLYEGQTRQLEKDLKKAMDNLEELGSKVKDPKSRLDKSEGSLNKRVEKLLSTKYIGEIIKVQVKEEGVSYEVDLSKKEEVKGKYFGKKLLVTDHGDWETGEIIESYREQDCIEKIFRESKDVSHCAVRPLYHWTDQKIRVHIFICLLGHALTGVLQKEASGHGLQLSKNRMLEELNGIRESWVKETGEGTGKIIKCLEEMNETQKKLWKITEEMKSYHYTKNP